MSIESLLRKRHENDQIFFECLMGRGGSRRYDAWVLRSSWSPMTTIGYEVKTDRGDFMRDTKWPDYLPGCSEFWFVCHHGLIQPEEMSEGVGLLWMSKNGKRLYSKRKAARREPDIKTVNRILTHIVMWKHHEKKATTDTRAERIEYHKGVLADVLEGRRVGHRLSRFISKRHIEIERESRRAKDKLRRWGRFAATLRANGIDPDTTDWEGMSQLRELIGAPSPRLVGELRRAARQIEGMADKLDGLGKG